MKTILFQGDSITDAGRSREDNYNKGIGYPTLVSASLGFDCPNEYTFVNKGVSGNRIVDVYARIKDDIINIKPDYMSILIGVNDVWHELEWNNGISTEKFEKLYIMLIEEIYEKLPDIKIMIIEPFALKGEATEKFWDKFEPEVLEKAAAAKRVAEKFNLPFISVQDKLNEALKAAPSEYWLKDGVHPNSAGHELIKREWLKVFKEL